MKNQILSLILLTALIAVMISCRHLQTYTIEDINDPYIHKYPAPVPVHPVSKSFVVADNNHVEEITLTVPDTI